jgi:hypothetical protein
LKKFIKYTKWVLGIALLLIIILFVILKIYVSSHKKEILEKINTEAGTLIGGSVSVGDLSVTAFKNFPNLAIQLKDIAVKDSLFAKHGHHLFYAQNLYLRLNTLSLLIGRISVNKLQIDSGGFYLFTDTSGYSNGYLLKPKTEAKPKEKKSATKNLFDKVELNRFALTIQDLSKDKLYDFYINKLEVKSKTTDSSIDLQLKKSILVKALAFKVSMGTYLENHLLEGEFAVHLLPKKQALRFDDIPMKISKQLFHLSGLFLFGTEKTFEIRAKTDGVLVDLAKTILTKKIQRPIGLVSLKTPIDLTATIAGSLVGGNPVIEARWKTEKNSIITPLLSFTNCSFNGIYTNQVVPGAPTTDPNSKVELTNFKGDWEGLTMTADTLQLNNLTTPVVTANLHSAFALTQLNAIMQSESMSLTKGTGTLNLSYKGPVANISTENATLDTRLKIQDGNILMTSSQANLTNCIADIHIQNSSFLINRLDCAIQNNPIHFQGEGKNVLSLLGDNQKPVSLALNVSAPVLDLGNITGMFYRKFPAKKVSANAKKGSLAKSVQKLDNLLSSGNIVLSLNAEKLRYHRFEAKKAALNITIDGDSWHLQKASFLHGAGSLSVTGKVTENKNARFALDATMQMKNLDAQQAWYQFNDFGMPSPTSKNIRGTLSANANVSLLMDKQGKPDMSTLSGNADFSIKNGALINFKPLQEIQKVAFKDRDFSNVTFAELKNTISFSKGTVTISRMEINSSVLSLYVEGFYGLKRNPTDISIQIPVSNLKKRDKDYKPENTGTDKKGGMSVFLRAKSDEDGTIKIKYDPFARFKKSPNDKKKNKSSE